MGTQILEQPAEGTSAKTKGGRRGVGNALDCLETQRRALTSYSLVEGSPTRCGQSKAHNFIAEKRLSPPVFH